MAEHQCCVCPQLRRGEPRVYDRANVCQGCRSRLRALLAEIVEFHGEVVLEKGSVAGSKISGSRTPPLPLAISGLDLTMPAHLGAVHEPTNPETKLPYGDQCGDISTATVLDSWARDWQSHKWALLPEPRVHRLAAWLTERLEWACDHHPAVDDFAWEINDLARKLRPRQPQAELKKGVPCRECDRVSLYRYPGSDYIECANCPCLMTPEEYHRWTALISAPEHQPWVREVVAAQVDASLA